MFYRFKKVKPGLRVVVAFNKKVVPKQIAVEESLKWDIKMGEFSWVRKTHTN